MVTRTIPAVLAAIVVASAIPAVGHARTPLPTIEVVQPERRRVRILDVRGAVQLGWGHSALWNTPVHAVSLETQISFVELSKTTWLHLSLAESFLVGPIPTRSSGRPPGLMGADLGLGLSRYAPGGPALFVTATGGPRFVLAQQRRDRLSVDGVGVIGRADVYPFYRSISELVRANEHWFRKYVLSGAHLWVTARHDHVSGHSGSTYAAGLGLDFARTAILPIVERLPSRR